MIKIEKDRYGQEELTINDEFCGVLYDYNKNISSEDIEKLLELFSEFYSSVHGFNEESCDSLYEAITDLREDNTKYLAALRQLQFFAIEYYKEHFKDQFKFVDFSDKKD